MTRFRFGTFELLPGERRLLAEGVELTLGDRAFDLLLALVERAGQLLEKQDLLAIGWPRQVVEENALQSQISVLRKILGFQAIVTVSRSGYRFVLPVERSTASGLDETLPPNNLPLPITTFIGREAESRELRLQLARARAVTLAGAGGIGKTRLALQVASTLGYPCSAGIWLIECTGLSDFRVLPTKIARTLGIQTEGGTDPVGAVASAIGSTPTLVVLDGVDGLSAGTWRLVAELLGHCAGLRVIMTRRERFDFTTEVVYRVPRLSIPARSQGLGSDDLLTSDSVRLMVERARLQRPHFSITSGNAGPLARVCRSLDGSPLAIELVAPWLRNMTMDDIEQSLDRHFAVAAHRARPSASKRSLHSVIDWSWNLLAQKAQVLLGRSLGFAGTWWTLESAEQVCGGDGIQEREVLELLALLVDRNLVMAQERSGVICYQLPGSVREHAEARMRGTKGLTGDHKTPLASRPR